jgi:hypothetical protein
MSMPGTTPGAASSRSIFTTVGDLIEINEDKRLAGTPQADRMA